MSGGAAKGLVHRTEDDGQLRKLLVRVGRD
jgi:hypothetical protein